MTTPSNEAVVTWSRLTTSLSFIGALVVVVFAAALTFGDQAADIEANRVAIETNKDQNERDHKAQNTATTALANAVKELITATNELKTEVKVLQVQRKAQ